MAAPSREPPWSNDEKNYLLAEIIKASTPTLSPNVLLNVITTRNIQPRWDDIPLPTGRSLNSCRQAFDDLRRSQSLPLLSGPGQVGPQTPLTALSPTLKRSFQPEGFHNLPGREIRPKPLSSSGAYGPPSGSANEPPAKRKRGRPTKLEQQAKQAARDAAARGEKILTLPAQPQAATPALSLSVGSSILADEVKPTMTPSSRMPITAVLTPNQPKSASHSGSSGSSGRRRRGRSGKSEWHAGPGASGERDPRQEYGSPYGHEDTPARTAVRRHREELEGPSLQATRGPSTGEEREKRHPPPPPRIGPYSIDSRPTLPLPPPPE